MPLFEWSDKFSVNIEELDIQHKKLISLINSLYDAKQNGDNHDYLSLSKVLHELVEYTKTHFKKEEELMEQYSYPDYNSHKSEHGDLLEKVMDLNEKYYSGKKEVATDIAILLNDWIAEHILVQDKKYSPFLSSKMN